MADKLLPDSFKIAQTFHRQNQLSEAELLYRQIIASAPKFAEAQHLLGILLSQKGLHEEGIYWLQKAIDLQPTQPIYYHNLGKIYLAMRQWDTAMKCYQMALKFAPNNAESWFGLGNARKGRNNLPDALKAYQKAIQLQPKFAMAYYNMGNTHQENGQMKSARDAYQKCLEIEPQNAQAHNNLGVILEYWEDGENAEKHYEIAQNLQPDFTEAWTNLAALYEKQGQIEKSRNCYQSILDKQLHLPQKDWIRWHLEQLSEIIWESREQILAFRQHLEQNIRIFQHQPPVMILSDFHRLNIQPPFDLAYQGGNDLPLKIQYGQFFESFFEKIRSQLSQVLPKPIPFATDREIKSKIPKVGFVVTQGHEGVFLKCMRGILNNLTSGMLDIYIVCSSPNGENILRPAILKQTIKYLSIAPRIDIAIQQVHAARFDILYYWEVGTDTVNYFLPFCQLAPVQCTSWGWPVTSGIPTMNYFLSCTLLETGNSWEQYSEKLICFKKLPTYYYRPPVPKELKNKTHFGLLPDDHIYLCAQNLRKVHPDMDGIFLRILQNDTQGILVFIEDKQTFITAKLKDRLQKNCSPVHDRIRFLNRMAEPDYLNLVAISEVILDTLHYTGGANTAYDAFAAGTPYITLPLNSHRSRYGAAAYQQLGVTDLIARDQDDYVAKAIKVANEPWYRANLSREILERTDRIFEDQEAVQELEHFFINSIQKQAAV